MRLDKAVLLLDGVPVTGGDVLATGVLGGAARPLLDRVGRCLAAAALAAETGVETTGDEIQEALDSWRVGRDLIAADEFRTWMAHHDVDLDAVVDHLDRELLRDKLESLRPREIAARRPAPREVLAVLPDEALLRGELETITTEVAVHLVAPPPGAERAEDVEGARRRLLEGMGCGSVEEAAELVAGLCGGTDPARRLLEQEIAFEVLRDAEASDEALRAELERARDELVLYEVAHAHFATEDVAREVTCCVREDREPFRRACARAGEPCEAGVLLARDLADVRFGAHLLAARPSQLFGPEPDGERHHVAQLVRREEPDAHSEDVRRALVERIVRRRLRPALVDRVTFRQEALR